MDIILVCTVNNLCRALNSIFLTALVSTVSQKYDIDIKIDYSKSRIFINILNDKRDSMYIKKCHLEDILQEIKKIESI